jgi:hypothetical protein
MPELTADSATNMGLSPKGALSLFEDLSKTQKTEEEKRQKAAEAQILSEEGQYTKPAPDFKPTQETASGFAALGALLAASGAILGSGGKTSGLMAMNAVTGMMNGYNAGRKDLYEQQRQQFEENMKSWEKHREQVKDAFDRAMKIAPYNLTLAQQSLNRDLKSLGLEPLAELNQKSGPMAAASAFNRSYNNTNSQLSKIIPAITGNFTEDQKKALANRPASEQLALMKAFIVSNQEKTEALKEQYSLIEKSQYGVLNGKLGNWSPKQIYEAEQQPGGSFEPRVKPADTTAEIKKKEERKVLAQALKDSGRVPSGADEILAWGENFPGVPMPKETKADEIAGQKEYLKEFVPDDRLKKLGTKEIAPVSNHIDAADQIFQLAELIKRTPKAAGVFGKTLSAIDKFLPRYNVSESLDPDIFKSQIQSVARDPSIFAGVPSDELSRIQDIQKRVIDVINARALAASGGSRMLISEFNAQKGVLNINNLPTQSAYDLYRDLGISELQKLRKYGFKPDEIVEIRNKIEPVTQTKKSDEEAKALTPEQKTGIQARIDQVNKDTSLTAANKKDLIDKIRKQLADGKFSDSGLNWGD